MRKGIQMCRMMNSISSARGPKRILSAAFITILALAAFVGGAVTAMPQEGAKSDGKIHDQVSIKMAGDQIVKGTGIDVAVKDGVVILTGNRS
ncbi:MAG: BON domain-containing protein [bacterium]